MTAKNSVEAACSRNITNIFQLFFCSCFVLAYYFERYKRKGKTSNLKRKARVKTTTSNVCIPLPSFFFFFLNEHRGRFPLAKHSFCYAHLKSSTFGISSFFNKKKASVKKSRAVTKAHADYFFFW